MKLDRLIGILTVLLQNNRVTAPQLAEKFEVTRRTIGRDIDALCQAGIPIVTQQGGGGGISIAEGYKLDKSVLTSDELQHIITGLKSLDSVSKTSNIERLIQKLSPNQNAMVSMNEHIMIDLSSYYKDSLSEKIGMIRQAINDRRHIEFDYYYSKGETQRKIEPYFIQFKWTSWYVYGFCTERQDFRLYKLNRLWGLVLTDEYFSPRTIPADVTECSRVSVEPYHVELLFDKSVRFRLIEDYGLHCYTEIDNGLMLDLGYTNRDYIKSWILGFGDAVTVISPDDFREEIMETVRKISEKYTLT